MKVDLKLLNKKNVQPLQTAAQREAVKAPEEQRKHEQLLLPQRQLRAEAARQHEEAEKRKAEAEKAHCEGEARREADLAARHAATQSAATEKAREEDEARAATAALQAAQEERRRREVAEEQARLARKDAQEKTTAWCKDHGFKDVNTSKKTYRGGVKFPLHTAVKHGNQEIIGKMLLLGLKKDVRDSKSQTPRHLAAKLNTNGSHDCILTMLQ